MKNLGTKLFPVVLLSLLAALTFWLQRLANFVDPMSRAKLRHDPDFIIENFSMVRFNAAGEIQNSLTAEKMLHFPDNDSTEVTSPKLDYPEGPRPTRVTAERAWLNHDGKEVRLSGNVHLVRQGVEDAPGLIVQTSALTVFPDDELARGHVPVTVSQGKSVVQGSGIEYRGRENIATLSGRVYGTFYRER